MPVLDTGIHHAGFWEHQLGCRVKPGNDALWLLRALQAQSILRDSVNAPRISPGLKPTALSSG